MTEGAAGTARAHIDGLLGWWRLAGVDTPVAEDRADWLGLKTHIPPAAKPSGQDAGADLPHDLNQFHQFLAASPGLPESRWPGPRILPAGAPAPRLMIVVDAPDADARESGQVFDADAARLLSRMTRAIGIDMSDCYVASLSLVTPPPGTMDPALTDQLAQRMRHHIALVEPAAVMLVGDRASRALLSTGPGPSAENLPFVNHHGGIVNAVPVVHPRLMLGQPSAKAEAWRSLRRLARNCGQ